MTQHVTTKKMTHKEAKDFREMVQDAVLYEHRKGGVFLLNTKEDNEYWGGRDLPRYYSDDVNTLYIEMRR